MRRRVVWSLATRDDYVIADEILNLPAGGEAVGILRVINGARDWPVGGWPEG